MEKVILTTSQLNQLAFHHPTLAPSFFGTVLCDGLPSDPDVSLPTGYIVNTDPGTWSRDVVASRLRGQRPSRGTVGQRLDFQGTSLADGSPIARRSEHVSFSGRRASSVLRSNVLLSLKVNNKRLYVKTSLVIVSLAILRTAPFEFRTPSSVLIVGPSGSGKTVFTTRLLTDNLNLFATRGKRVSRG